jgi:Mrp family chromosome partitioning ATPase
MRDSLWASSRSIELMEPLHYLRLLRRRWIIIFLFTAIGAGLGCASTLARSDDDTPVQTYWVAAETLIVDLRSGAASPGGLLPLAEFATRGDVPSDAAVALGIDDSNELGSVIRAVADTAQGTLEISAAATEEDAASDRARVVTATFLDWLEDRREADYDAARTAANAEIVDRRNERDQLDSQIATLQGDDDGEPLSPSDATLLNGLLRARETAALRAINAFDQLTELERTGVADPQLIYLDAEAPLRISAASYFSRVNLGLQGERSFLSNQVAPTSPVLEEPGGDNLIDGAAGRSLLGGIAGLLLGASLVLAHFRFDPRLRTPEDVERAFGYSVIGEVPVISRKDRRAEVLHAVDQPRSYITEAHRYLRSALLFARFTVAPTPVHTLTDSQTINGISHDEDTEDTEDAVGGVEEREARVVMVTSAAAADGKTTTAANLAVTLAEAGYDTVLINCDHRIPAAHHLLGRPYLPGEVQETKVDNLRFIADVERDVYKTPEKIIQRQRTVIENARQIVDVVVLDTAPLLATNDAVDLLPSTDLVVLVCREGKTNKDDATETRDLLDRMGVPVAGVLVTGARGILGGRYYGRNRYGRYYQNESSVPPIPPAPEKVRPPKSRGPSHGKDGSDVRIDLRTPGDPPVDEPERPGRVSRLDD